MIEEVKRARTGPPGARCPRGAAVAAALLTAMVAAACDVPTALPRFENTLVLPAPDVSVPVTGVPAPAIPIEVDLSNVDEDFASRARGGEIQFTPVNPEVATGSLEITIRDMDSSVVVTQTVTVDGSGAPQIVRIDRDPMLEFLGGNVEITVTGVLGPGSVPPRFLTLEALVRITFEVGGD